MKKKEYLTCMELHKKLKEDKVLRQSMTEYSLSRHEEYSIQGRAKGIMEFINRLC